MRRASRRRSIHKGATARKHPRYIRGLGFRPCSDTYVDQSIEEVVMSTAEKSTVKKEVQNGVNVAALLGAREALSKAPEAARFSWRASCKWMNGTHSQTSVKGFYGL